MSSPIAIPSRFTPSSAASSPGLYVPVHRRTGSSSSSSSYSRSASSNRSEPEHPSSSFPLYHLHNASKPPCHLTASPLTPHPSIYSRATLLNLATSPLSRMSTETRESLRISVPEIVTNRKQRKAIEYRQNQVQSAIVSSVRPVIPQRIRPVGRLPDKGRRNAGKVVVDELGWRGRSLVIVPLPPIVL